MDSSPERFNRGYRILKQPGTAMNYSIASWVNRARRTLLERICWRITIIQAQGTHKNI